MRRTIALPLISLAGLLVLLGGCGSQPDPETELGGISTTEVLDGMMQRVTRALNGITGMDSAKAARPKLALINTDYDDLLYHAPKLSVDGRAKLAQAAARYMPDLQRMLGMIEDSPALEPILGHEMRTLLEKHQQLMSTTDAPPEGR